MYKKMVSTIESNLNKLDFVKKDSNCKDFISKSLFGNEFIDELKELYKSTSYSCNDVLNLSRDIMLYFSDSEPDSDWLFYTYQYILSLSYPHAVTIALNSKFNNSCVIYLEILKSIRKIFDNDGIYPIKNDIYYPFKFLCKTELQALDQSGEYSKFIEVFEKDYICELMLLNQEITGYNTLSHISGVHHIAVSIGRQLKSIDSPIDLGRVSGAAAGHDLGKYGCVGEESNRVPYLHYYYTEQWFNNHNIPMIGHIATNHSVWDLELENLPIESLILIYADFRVKNIKTTEGSWQMKIFSLKDSFDVILNKLDQLDEKKEKRYRRVYSKLKDFEDYMVQRGINVSLDGKPMEKVRVTHLHLLSGQPIVDHLKYSAIDHNIKLMHRLRSEASLSSLLELARTENDQKKLRGYIQVLEEYSTHLTQRQKIITITFLYDLMVHPEEDLRKKCADLIGTLIAGFDEHYRKEVPKSANLMAPEITSVELLDRYFYQFLSPDHKYIDVHREWIGYGLRNLVNSVFKYSGADTKESYFEIITPYYENADFSNSSELIYLLEAFKYIPYFDESHAMPYYRFIENCLALSDEKVTLSALERAYYLLDRCNNSAYFSAFLESYLVSVCKETNLPSISYLRYKVSNKLFSNNALTQLCYEQFTAQSETMISDIFLRNLKTATNWIDKKINIEILLKSVEHEPSRHALHTAMHYCNLLKVSAVENVRNHAGMSLLLIAPYLTVDQRNDVCIELIRALEMENYHFTKYIPYYLGRMLLFLQPQEFDEILDDFCEKIRKANRQISLLILSTVGNCLQVYQNYSQNFEESKDVFDARFKKLLGILITGLVNYDIQVRQEAFLIIGTYIFGTKKLTINQKYRIFRIIAKRILILSAKYEDDELLFLNSSASLNHIYRFISDYNFFIGELELEKKRKIAFFPGTFDPFTLGHKEIAKNIRDLGFEVFLAVDEFSWSKRTQPHMLRREIIAMSIADEFNIQILPPDFQVNISNPASLMHLRHSFDTDVEVYVVVGSDVILNASSYKIGPTLGSIHSFSHIIFERRNTNANEDNTPILDEKLKSIKGDTIRLKLPPQYEDISSTQIRNYIDQNRDISALIDPLAQKFIYETGIYRREPQYKSLLQTSLIKVEVVEDLNMEILSCLNKQFFEGREDSLKNMQKLAQAKNPRILMIKDMISNTIIGFSFFHWTRSSMLFHEFKDNKISEFIREKAIGRIIVIDGIFSSKKVNYKQLNQILLTETLSFCLARDYTYGIYHEGICKIRNKHMTNVLQDQGFSPINIGGKQYPVYHVNMSNPCTLTLDLDTIIKEPFRSNDNVKRIILKTRKRLQRTLTKLYPGNLILSFDRDMLYQKLIQKICQINDVSPIQTEPRVLGTNVCAPFGSILKGYIVPNTITKSIHSEKMFAPDIESFTIEPYPHYMSLNHQIEMINAFNKPIILVDDLLNKGYRIKVLDPLLKEKHVDVKQILVGILSGRGKELMDLQERSVDSAYFLPKLRVWFNENTFYPFIGGETVWRGQSPKINLIPSLNFILPYATPNFIKGADELSIFELSKVAIENSRDILKVLEKEYLKLTERNLTLRHLGEVFISPRYPDRGKFVDYDLNLSPSRYLENDLEHLNRIKNFI